MSKTIVITGASDGIGAAGARLLRAHGHRVVVIGRSPDKTRQVGEELGAAWFTADFTRLADVRALASTLRESYSTIDVLANNAGGVFGDRTPTVDGFEKTFQVNHLAPFLLTNLLLDTLLASRATVIQTSSIAARLYGGLDLDDVNNEHKFSANKAYGDAKLANILLTAELHRRFNADGLNAAAFHPGLIRSNFGADTTSNSMKMMYSNPLARPFLRTAKSGADQLVWLAESAPGPQWQSGRYFEKRRIATRLNPQSTDSSLARRLWDLSAQLTDNSAESSGA